MTKSEREPINLQLPFDTEPKFNWNTPTDLVKTHELMVKPNQWDKKAQKKMKRMDGMNRSLQQPITNKQIDENTQQMFRQSLMVGKNQVGQENGINF